MKYMTRILLSVVLLFLTFTLNLVYAKPLQEGVVWLSYDGDAFISAKKASSPVLLFVSASWCEHCQDMLKKTLRDPKVAKYIQGNFVTVFANTDELAVLKRYHITELPSLLVLNSSGDVIEQLTGYRDSDETMKVLLRASGKASSMPRITLNALPRGHHNIQNRIGKRVVAVALKH